MKTVRSILASSRAAMALGCMAVPFVVGSASAHRSPLDCTTNSLTVSISRPEPVVNHDDQIPYTVALEVPDTFGFECEATDIIVSFFPPNAPPNGATACSSSNGVILQDALGRVMFDLFPGEVVVFFPADNPILDYTVNHADENATGGVQAFACGLGISHTAPGDPDSAIDNREITTFVNHPGLKVEKTGDPSVICAGDPTDVTFTYMVMWDDTTDPPADTPLENISLTSTACGPIDRVLPDPVGNNNDILEDGEIWEFQCTTEVIGETTCSVTASGDDFSTGLTVENGTEMTITEVENPTCTISGADVVCPGGMALEYTVSSDSIGATFDWTITGDATFCGGGTTDSGDTVCIDTSLVCDGSFTLSVITTLGDCDGECEKTVTMTDDIDPTITCPGNILVQCLDEVPVPNTADVTCTDNCTAEGDLIVQHVSDFDSGTTCPKIITRTYSCTDACGNVSTCVQAITIDDRTPPVITCPGPIAVECIDDIPAPNIALITCTDNCTTNVQVEFVNDTPSGTTCPLIITRVYRCIDDCNNISECQQVITVTDTVDPVITCPDDVDVECLEDVPAPNIADVTCSDNCSLLGGLTVEHVSDAISGTLCPRIITRTYRCTDECGNSSECEQIITVDDQTAPVITCPADVNVECLADVPAVNLDDVDCTDNCDDSTRLVVEMIDENTSGSCPTIITRTFRCTDLCGNESECTQTITVLDVTDPVITCPGDVIVDCLGDVPAADLDAITCTDNCTASGDLSIIMVSEDESGECPLVITRVFRCTDECGNTADCTMTVTVDDQTPPNIICPGDILLPEGPFPSVDDTVGLVICTDLCGSTITVHIGDEILELCPGGSVKKIRRTYECTDGCNTVQCDHIIEIDPCPPTPEERCCGEKGSLIIFSKVELRWDSSGNLIQDSFLSLTNDYNEDVVVQMYFVNGDAFLPATDGEREHPGWNHVSAEITLTKNESTYWSAFSGQPKGVAPFPILDPTGLGGPGRPDGMGGRVLRGFVVAWAVNSDNEEVRWNHLAGSAVVINYDEPSAWEYRACAFKVLVPVANGEQTGFDPGVLNLDGLEYSTAGDLLLLDFYSFGSSPFSSGPVPSTIESALTLQPITMDLRQEDDGPITTKAKIDVWNENEVKFNGMERCITCWDCTLLGYYADFGIPNNFLYSTLQTDKGKARIDGLESQNCDVDVDPVDGPLGFHPDDVISQDAALIGLTSKHVRFEAAGDAAAGTMLICLGAPEEATIRYDVESGGGLEATGPEIVDEMLDAVSDELGEITDEARRARR